MIHLDCPQCGHGMELDEGFLGGVCRCSECGTMVTVPKELGGEVKSFQLSKPKPTYTSSPRTTATDELTRALSGTSVLRSTSTIETAKNNKPMVIGGIAAVVLFILLVIGAILTSGGTEVAPERVDLTRSQQDHERIRQGLPTRDDLRFELQGAPETVIQKLYDDKLSLNQARVIWRQQQEGTPDPTPAPVTPAPAPPVVATAPTPAPVTPAPDPTPAVLAPAALTFDEITLPTEAGYAPNTFDADVVTFDLSKQLNVDVLYNGYGASADKTQDGIDNGGSSLVSMSIAGYYRGAEGQGIPNNGRFGRNADHPDLQLYLNDSDNNANAVRVTSAAPLVIDTPAKIYHHVHLLAVAGDGAAQVEVVLAYDSGPEQRITLTIDDWFSDTRPDQGGGSVTPPGDGAYLYQLINGMDRSKGATGFDNINDAAIFGYRLITDKTRRLTRMTIQRRDQNDSLLTVFGASGEIEVGGTMNLVLSPWQSIGPFAADNMDAAFDKEFGPEIDRAKGLVNIEYEGHQWTLQNWADDQSHEFNFERRDNYAVYLYRTVESPTPGRMDISVGSDDSISIWVNGERHWHHKIGRGVDDARDRLTVPVRQGINHLMMKISQGGGGAGFYFKLNRAIADAVPLVDLPPEPPIAADGLMGHWTFNQANVTPERIADLLGHRHGVPKGMTSFEGARRFETGRPDGGDALRFDGVDDYIELAEGLSDFSKGMSVTFWAKPEESRAWARFIDLGKGREDNNIVLARENNTNALILDIYHNKTKAGSLTAPDAIENGAWHHYAFTISEDGTATIYRDGKNIATGPIPLPLKAWRTSNLVGKSNWDSADAMYKGWMDDLRLYARALSAEEMMALIKTESVAAAPESAPKPEETDPNVLYREALRLQTELQKAEQRHRIQLRDKIPPPIEAIQGRFLRVTRKGKTGVLHIAEVQVFDLSDMNIAPTGSAKQSSTEQGGIAQRAIDGNTDGIWENNSMTHTKNEKEPWWELDLKRTTPILKIMIWNRSNADPERLDGATVELLDENRQVVWEKTTEKPRPSATFILPRPPANADEYMTEEKLKALREQVDAAKRRWIEAKRKAGS